MASSACPKCGNHTFELAENQPHHAHFKLWFVQCRTCGTVVGTMDYYQIGNKVRKIYDGIKAICKAIHIDLE